jgi:hypothetical protein
MEVIERTAIVDAVSRTLPVLAEAEAQVDRAALVWCPHPITTRDRAVIFEQCLPGENLHTYLQRVAPDILTADCVLVVGDRSVLREWWPYVRVKSGQIIRARAVARDSGGGGEGEDGGSNVGRVLGLIVVAVLSYYTAGAYGALYGAVVSVAGTYAVNALFPPPSNTLEKLGGKKESSVFSLSGGSNQIRSMECIPMVLGSHRMFPDFAAKPYTQIEGEDDYMYLLFDWGLGRPRIDNLKIGETPIDQYEEVQTWLARDVCPVTWPVNVDSTPGGELRWADGFMFRTTSENTVRIAVDLNGIFYRTGKQGLESNSATLQMEFRPVGSGEGDWQPIFRDPIPNYYTQYWSQGYWLETWEDDQTGGSSGSSGHSDDDGPGSYGGPGVGDDSTSGDDE